MKHNLVLYRKNSKRDYSGNERDVYAQLLQTIHLHLSLNNEEKEFLELLEIAEKQNKKIALKNFDVEEIFFKDLILV